jgi:hypothetical protein
VGDEPPPARHLLWAPAALRARRDAENRRQL